MARPNRDLALADVTSLRDPSRTGPAPEAETVPSTVDIRAVYLRHHKEHASSGGTPMSSIAKRLTIVSRIRTTIQSRFRANRRVAALATLGAACGLLIVVSHYDVATSMRTLSGATDGNAFERLASSVSAALEVIGGRAEVSAVPVQEVAPGPMKVVPTGTRRPLYSSTTLPLAPLVSAGTAHAIEPAPIDGAEVTPLEDAPVETSSIYSLDDTDVTPPVAIRSPGLAVDRVQGDGSASLIEILVSEAGLVESATGLHRPATIGAALEFTTALSVVKTWRFLPARKNGQAVKYRTTVPVAQTMNPAGTRDGAR